MQESLTKADLVRLVQRIFHPRPDDRALAVLVDLPDAQLPDHERWKARREMAADWHRHLVAGAGELGLETVSLVLYRNVRRNNADLPVEATIHEGGDLPQSADEIQGGARPFDEILGAHRILLAVTELSATAPLKLAAPRLGFRAATMPGFSPEMIPALRLDYEEINARCVALKERLDRSSAARIRFAAAGRKYELTLDLRYREATASGGLVHDAGRAGNLPSGETYIVPYEGEREGEASRTRGELPIELDGELLFYRIEENRVAEVIGEGPVAARERAEMESEPAYRNVAELGLGLLAGYGIHPIGELLLDEKLGLHIAFGRSDHFGGQVGAKDFSSPDKVVHIDRVYIPEVQPSVRVLAVDLVPEGGGSDPSDPLMRGGDYV
jgi:hypothetical protein